MKKRNGTVLIVMNNDERVIEKDSYIINVTSFKK